MNILYWTKMMQLIWVFWMIMSYLVSCRKSWLMFGFVNPLEGSKMFVKEDDIWRKPVNFFKNIFSARSIDLTLDILDWTKIMQLILVFWITMYCLIRYVSCWKSWFIYLLDAQRCLLKRMTSGENPWTFLKIFLAHD